jgi:hypothetical protein
MYRSLERFTNSMVRTPKENIVYSDPRFKKITKNYRVNGHIGPIPYLFSRKTKRVVKITFLTPTVDFVRKIFMGHVILAHFKNCNQTYT